MDGRALVAWNLRRFRVRRGISQEHLAYDAGVDRSYMGGLERQEENPTVDVLGRLAKTLQVSVFELFKEPRKGSAPPKPLRSGPTVTMMANYRELSPKAATVFARCFTSTLWN
jgi:transcriptional regulator with XRE-family HTH domain